MNIQFAQKTNISNPSVIKMLQDLFPFEANTEEFLSLITCTEEGKVAYSFSAMHEGEIVGLLVGNSFRGEGSIDLIAVAKKYQRRGIGSELLSSFEEKLVEHDISRIKVGESSASYIWPGIDTRYVSALVLFQRKKYSRKNVIFNLKCRTDTNPNLKISPGVKINKVTLDNLVSVSRFAREKFSDTWGHEIEIATNKENANAFVATVDGEVVGFSAHSVYRNTYFGPLATDAKYRGRGIGETLLWASLKSMHQQGILEAEINWISEESLPFYVKSCNAVISGVFISLEKKWG